MKQTSTMETPAGELSEIIISCPGCGSKYSVAAEWEGAQTACDICGRTIPVQMAEPESGPASGNASPYLLILHGFGLKFRFFAAGGFIQGSENGYTGSQPRHKTLLPQSFWLAETPVSQQAFENLMGFNPSLHSGAGLPVENVSWHQAADFCYSLAVRAQSEDVLPDELACRLPTEAEWEYACRLTMRGLHSVPLDKLAWFRDNSGLTTHPVGCKPEDPSLIYDMLGNVREWCLDWMDDYPVGDCINSTGPSEGKQKVLRGGSCLSTSFRCRADDRIGLPPETRLPMLGFRPVLVPRIFSTPHRLSIRQP